MESFESLFFNVLLFILLMLPGFLMGKLRRIDHAALPSLGNLLSDVAMPALVFVKLLETDFSAIALSELLCSIGLPLLIVGLLSAIAIPVFFWQKGSGLSPVSRFCSVYSNCGFLGIPLASALFPTKPEITVFVSLFNVVSTFLLLSVGAATLSGERHVRPWRLLLTPGTLAVLVGIPCSILCGAQLREGLVTYSSWLSQLTAPLSMVVLGYHLSGMKLREAGGHLLPGGLLVAALKLVLAPLLALGALLLLRLLPGVQIGGELAIAMCIATAVSTAASAPALAGQYGLDDSYATTATLANTLLCVVTLPLMCALFGAFFPV